MIVTILLLVVGVTLLAVGLLAALSYSPKPEVIHLPAREPMKIIDRLMDRAELQKRLAELPRAQTVNVNAGRVIELMKEEVFGQDRVIEDAVTWVWGNFAAVNRTTPVGVFLIVGPPGTAKSRFGKALGVALYGTQGAEVIDMSEFSSAHSASGLFGSAPDHQGGMGRLTTYLIGSPRAVVVLDEFEKAHRDVQRKFLGPWNDGVVVDQKTGRKVSTTDAIFVVTTNAQEDQIAKLAVALKHDPVELEQRVREVLKNEIENSILSRIEKVFVFQPLEAEPFVAMVLSFIDDLANRYNIEIKKVDTEAMYQYCLKHYRDKVDGRAVGGFVRQDMMAEFIKLQQAGAKGAKIGWNAKKNTLSVTAAP